MRFESCVVEGWRVTMSGNAAGSMGLAYAELAFGGYFLGQR